MPMENCCIFVDNDIYNQAIFTRALHDVSPRTICFAASSAVEALFMLTKENIIPSYIFMELNLPQMSGIEFLKTIKQVQTLQEIPVVIHTVAPKPDEIIAIKEFGALAIYFRPYEYFSLCNMLGLYFTSDLSVISQN
jgi:CheY-like chemotaxis protein